MPSCLRPESRVLPPAICVARAVSLVLPLSLGCYHQCPKFVPPIYAHQHQRQHLLHLRLHLYDEPLQHPSTGHPSIAPSTHSAAITSSAPLDQPVIVHSSSPGRVSPLSSQELVSCRHGPLTSPAPLRLTSRVCCSRRSILARCRFLTQPALPFYTGASISHESPIPAVGSRHIADAPAVD